MEKGTYVPGLILGYTVGRRSQGSDGQWNLSSDANRSVSTRRRCFKFDGVDSTGDKTPITSHHYPDRRRLFKYSDKTTIATFPAYQDDLLKC